MLLIYVVPIAIGAVVLFWVIRSAVLSALRAHHAELKPKPANTSYLDADGL